MMSHLRAILQASPYKTLWRRFQIPRFMPARPCSLYTCTYKSRNRVCEYMAAWTERKPGCFLRVTCVECVQLWCQWHSRLGLDALRRIPHYFSVKIWEVFPLTLLSYSWPKSEAHIMMMYSGTFHPSLEIAEELLVADQLARVWEVADGLPWLHGTAAIGCSFHAVGAGLCTQMLHGIPNCPKTSLKVPWRQSHTGTEPLGW